MGILENELTQKQEVTRLKNRIAHKSNKLYERINRYHEELFNLIWTNEYDISPQEILDAYGSEAKDLFLFSGAIQQLLFQVNSEYTPLTTPSEYTINPDGTVTVSQDVS